MIVNQKKDKGHHIRRTDHRIERRKSKDFWYRLFILVNYFAWLVLFVTLIVFHKAQPEFETVFDRFYQLDLRTTWDMQFVYYFAYAIAVGLACSLTGLGLSLFRARRQSDHKTPILILGVLYLVLFILSWFLL